MCSSVSSIEAELCACENDSFFFGKVRERRNETNFRDLMEFQLFSNAIRFDNELELQENWRSISRHLEQLIGNGKLSNFNGLDAWGIRMECWTLRMANCYSKRTRHLHPRGQTQSRLMPNYNTYSSESALHRMHIVSRNILVEYFLYIMLLFHFLSLSLFLILVRTGRKDQLKSGQHKTNRSSLDIHFGFTLWTHTGVSTNCVLHLAQNRLIHKLSQGFVGSFLQNCPFQQNRFTALHCTNVVAFGSKIHFNRTETLKSLFTENRFSLFVSDWEMLVLMLGENVIN